jgi:hypothetical protein
MRKGDEIVKRKRVDGTAWRIAGKTKIEYLRILIYESVKFMWICDVEI